MFIYYDNKYVTSFLPKCCIFRLDMHFSYLLQLFIYYNYIFILFIYQSYSNSTFLLCIFNYNIIYMVACMFHMRLLMTVCFVQIYGA